MCQPGLDFKHLLSPDTGVQGRIGSAGKVDKTSISWQKHLLLKTYTHILKSWEFLLEIDPQLRNNNLYLIHLQLPFSILLHMIHDGSRKFGFIKRDETDFLFSQNIISILATAGKVGSQSVQNYNFEPSPNCAQ